MTSSSRDRAMSQVNGFVQKRELRRGRIFDDVPVPACGPGSCFDDPQRPAQLMTSVAEAWAKHARTAPLLRLKVLEIMLEGAFGNRPVKFPCHWSDHFDNFLETTPSWQRMHGSGSCMSCSLTAGRLTRSDRVTIGLSLPSSFPSLTTEMIHWRASSQRHEIE